MNRYMICAFAIATALTAPAATIDFTYNAAGADPEGFGYKKDQTYDVGVALSSPQLIGKRILGFSVPVTDTGNLSSPSAWLSKELDTSKGNESVFTPDIASYDASIEGGILSVTLPEPYTIPEEGVFLGYSFSIDGLDTGQKALPVAVVAGKTEGGLWVHANKSQKKWADMSKRENIVSAMTVSLEGDFPANSASVDIAEETLFAAENESLQIEITLSNYGTEGISSFEYVYTVNGVETAGSYDFSDPVPPVLGRGGVASVEISPQVERGDFTLDFSVTGVNGSANEYPSPSFSIPFTVQAFVPVYRPLAEEYTGLNCGWCPRGFVMLEQMKELHGDLFVGMSYHSTAFEHGAMCCVPEFPVGGIISYPAATFNRGGVVNPSDIPSLWYKSRNINTPAEIAVDLEWADEGHTRLKAVGRARFMNDIPESEYLMSFALVADGLSDPDWGQSNSYSDYAAEGEYTGPFWDLFVGKDKTVYGLIFNDIVVYYPDMHGVEGSLPESIEAEKWYEWTFEVNTEDVVNLSGEHIVSDFGKTRVVAMIVNRNGGKPLNCISSLYPDGGDPFVSGIEMPETSEATVVRTVFYDLQGRTVESPGHGLFIRCDYMNDGTRKVTKTIR